MLGIPCVGVGECHSEDPFACFNAKPTQRVCVRDLPRDRKKTREGRSQRRTKKEVEQRSQQNGAVSQREHSTEVGEADRQEKKRWMLGPVDSGPEFDQRGRMSQRSWLICGNFAWIHARASPQMHRILGKCHKLLPSCPWS